MKGQPNYETERFHDLKIILQYDSFQKDNAKAGFFATSERFMINQERAKILSADNNFRQRPELENKIQFVLKKIQTNQWKPL
jgi:hypothetical protein